jgi:hypothetical protein
VLSGPVAFRLRTYPRIAVRTTLVERAVRTGGGDQWWTATSAPAPVRERTSSSG